MKQNIKTREQQNFTDDSVLNQEILFRAFRYKVTAGEDKDELKKPGDRKDTNVSRKMATVSRLQTIA